MKIFYWSPFLSNIATVDSVINSINAIKYYDEKKKINPIIIDSVGEWSQKKLDNHIYNVRQLYKYKIYNFLPKKGYLKSRISQILIFLLSFNNLRKLLIKEVPEYFIAHLIISLPLVLFCIFNFKTKLIIRISGTPKLNFVRKFFWKILSKKVYKITCPTNSTYEKLKKLKIFSEDKLEILYDPIISVKKINKKKLEEIDEKFRNDDFILGIGRLTKQKNFKFLIKSFYEINLRFPKLKLVILGEGEERAVLEKLINNLELKGKVFLEGHKKNVFNYIYRSKCFVSSSLYEDPGFVIIEAGFLNKIVFAADSNTGPSEILDHSKRGFLYKNNNHHDMVKNFLNFIEKDPKSLKEKKIELKKYSKNFTIFSHYKSLKKILFN